ncbi:hypothetical protein R1flu_017050 [Riccia fluitans]|uniref:MADS-box protein n=1 Tax=Riccia fluitans TaxID=41844 RepID=A0ABD1YRM5_9MARC
MELEDEEKHRASKQQEDVQRIVELQQCVTELVREMEQYHINEGFLAKVEWEATQGDRLQEDLDRIKRQLKVREIDYCYSKRRKIARRPKLHA